MTSHENNDEEQIDLQSHEVDTEKETENSPPPSDRFTQLMFGNRIPKKYREEYNSNEKQEEEQSKEANYFTLMEQIDDIMNSLENLKPVLQEFAPIVEYIKKKMKT